MTARKNTGLKIKIASSIVSPRALAAQNASVAAADLDT